MVSRLDFKHNLRRAIALLLCIAAPFVWEIDKGYLAWSLFTGCFLGYLFYDSDSYNIRFVVGLIAIYLLVDRVVLEFAVGCARQYCGIETQPRQFLFVQIVQMLSFFSIIILMLRRDWLVNKFKKVTSTGKRHRLIGVEFLVLGGFIFHFIAHILYTVFAMNLMNTSQSEFLASNPAATLWDTNMAVFDALEPYAVTYETFYVIMVCYMLLALQTYNYRIFRSQWAIKF